MKRLSTASLLQQIMVKELSSVLLSNSQDQQMIDILKSQPFAEESHLSDFSVCFLHALEAYIELHLTIKLHKHKK